MGRTTTPTPMAVLTTAMVKEDLPIRHLRMTAAAARAPRSNEGPEWRQSRGTTIDVLRPLGRAMRVVF